MMRASGLGLRRSGSGLDTGERDLDLDRDLDLSGDLDLGLGGDCDFMGDFDRELGRGWGDLELGGEVGRSCLICT